MMTDTAFDAVTARGRAAARSPGLYAGMLEDVANRSLAGSVPNWKLARLSLSRAAAASSRAERASAAEPAAAELSLKESRAALSYDMGRV